MRTVESYVAGRWQPGGGGRTVVDAVTGELIASVGSEGVDLAAAHAHARTVGGPALRALTFHERAALLRAVGKHLLADTSEFYALSTRTGATRADTAIDVDGGAGALLAYSGIGRRELPNSTLWPDGDVQSLSRDGSFVARHVNVARPGVAIQINAFNFPVWGMLEKLAPAFLAGVPTIVKPATPTAYVAEAAVRTILASGLLPEGSLQFVAGDITPIFDLLDEQDSLAFTGSAATARSLRTIPAVLERGVRFSAAADSLNAAVLAPSAGPDTAEFGAFCGAVVGEMVAKAGQKCTAIRRVIVPDTHLDTVSDALVARLEAITVGHPADDATDMGPSSVWSSEPTSTPPSPAWGPARCSHRNSPDSTPNEARSWRRHCCAPTIRPRRPLTSSSRSARCRPSSAIRTSTVRLRSSPRAAAVLSRRFRARHRRDRADHPRDRAVPRSGPHHRRNIHGCVDRPWFTASATCSRRARSSGWR